MSDVVPVECWCKLCDREFTVYLQDKEPIPMYCPECAEAIHEGLQNG